MTMWTIARLTAAAGALLALVACGGKAQVDGTGGGSGGSGGSGAAGGSGGGGGTGGAQDAGATGGAGGASGMGGGGSGGGASCTSDDDCQLVNSCCDCLALPASATAPECTMPECYAPSCEARGLWVIQVRCVQGACILGVPCAGPVNCDAPTPQCGPGEVVSRNSTGTCWGGCVSAMQCASVDSCDVCASAQFQCTTTSGVPQCVPFPPD